MCIWGKLCGHWKCDASNSRCARVSGDFPNIAWRYSFIEASSTGGFRLMIRTMFQMRPARCIAASYWSLSRPVASSNRSVLIHAMWSLMGVGSCSPEWCPEFHGIATPAWVCHNLWTGNPDLADFHWFQCIPLYFKGNHWFFSLFKINIRLDLFII